MNNAQLAAKVLTNLQQRGLSFEQVKSAAVSIIPAVLEAGGEIEKNVNFLCECFARRMKSND